MCICEEYLKVPAEKVLIHLLYAKAINILSL